MSGGDVKRHSDEFGLPHFLLKAGAMLARGDDYFRDVLDALPAAVYTTDAAGQITYYNDAAASLWGHRPQLGDGEWCGSWKLYWPDGRPLPHDQCPMALAIKQGVPIRGMEAVAERPDGIRIPFIPYPTPLFDSTGTLVGAVNMLVDISDRKRAEESVRRLAAIVESSDDAIVSKDLDGIITSWNRGAELMFGYTPEEVIGKNISILIPPERANEEPEILNRVRRGERVDHYETVRRHKDGTLIDVSLTVSPVRTAEGTIIGASKVSRDITARKQASAYAHQLAAIVESSDDAIVSKNLDGIITSWNRGAQELFGYTAEEAVGKPVAMLIPPDRIDEEPGILDRIRHGERVAYYETVRQRKDGSLVDVGLVVSPLRNPDGKVIGASKIARDITERKRAREQQRLMVEETKHRMRNTLATVQAIATRTLRASDEERRSFIARLAALARAHDLLTTENWNRAPLGDVIGRTLSPFRDRAFQRFVVEGPENVWLSANHASLLTIALHELATNASKYGALSNQSGQVRLAWTFVKKDDATRLRVCWRESGGPPVKPPARSGFGSFLIERVLKSEGGEARLDYDRQGLVATFYFTC
jgi:PAS domain S-box-containing protein